MGRAAGSCLVCWGWGSLTASAGMPDWRSRHAVSARLADAVDPEIGAEALMLPILPVRNNGLPWCRRLGGRPSHFFSPPLALLYCLFSSMFFC